MSHTKVSFEFFPPKTDKGLENLMREIDKLMVLDPEFMTVTFGAGGSTRDGTLDTACCIKDVTAIPMGAHLTHFCMTKQELKDYSQELWDKGIRRIVALRGDLPEDWSRPEDKQDEYYTYTSCFVEGLLAHHDFDISVSAYPEKHPDAPSLDADIDALKMKQDAGAHRAITQFFFENETYYEFVEKAQAKGVTIPIVAGLLPIQDYKRMMRFSEACEAHVPQVLRDKLEPLQDNPEETKKITLEYLEKQVADLVENKVEHLHFYSLNKADLIVGACTTCDLDVKSEPQDVLSRA